MPKFKELVDKAWVFGAAAVMIGGTSSVMAFWLSQNTHAATVVHTAIKHSQPASSLPQSSAGYTVIDQSKKLPSHPSAFLLDQWTHTGITTEKQVDQKYREWIANHTPRVIDMSAQQAAAYAAAIVNKAYGLDLKGYVADAEFQTLPNINSNQWVVEFYDPKIGKTVNYQCSVDSVTGIFLDLYANNSGNERWPSTAMTQDLSWVIPTAKQDISNILPKHVFITSSKIVAHKGEFVYVVGNLSNGAAVGISLKTRNQFAYWYHDFPNGYDGSWAVYNAPGNTG